MLSQHESAIVLDAAQGTSFLEVNVWGMFFYGVRIHFESKEMQGISLAAFLGCVLFFIRHAARMHQALGYSGSIEIETILSPVLRVNWLHDWPGYPVVVRGSELDDEVALTIPTTSEALREKPDRVATEIFQNVFFSVNCADMANTPDKLERLVRQGYEYNGWRPSTNLLI